MEAVKIRLLPVGNDGSAIMVNVSVVITLIDNDGSVMVLMIPVADDVTVAVPVTISVTLTNRYANRADTNAHLFRSSRHCAANSSDGAITTAYLIIATPIVVKLCEGNASTPGSFRISLGSRKGRQSFDEPFVRLCVLSRS